MLVKFGIDTEALATTFADSITRRGIHKRLILLWREFGILVDDFNNYSNSELAKAIENLPQDLKKLGQEAMRHQRTMSAKSPWRPLSKLDNTAQLSDHKKQIQLAILEETRAALLGLTADQDSLFDPSHHIEICRFDFFDHSQAFQTAKALSRKTIAAGERVSTVWQQLFSTIAEHSRRNVIIIDRYAAERHATTTSSRHSGLRRILTELDGGVPGCNVAIYSALDKLSDLQVTSSLKALTKTLTRGGISEIKLHLCPNTDFGQIAHYRYIRFEKIICQLDSGLEVLEGESVYRDCPFTMRSLDPKFRDNEVKLRHLSTEIKLK